VKADAVEGLMQLEQVKSGQRIRVNLPGLGDHGQVGTIRKIWNDRCYVHLDWDQRASHVVWFYAADLDLLSNQPVLLHTQHAK
jgi:hypothetical protein